MSSLSSTKYDLYLEPSYDIDARAETFVLKRIGTEFDVQDVADNLM